MSISPLVSVITPAYNHENFVQKAIQSVIDQTYPKIEYLIFDDGSRDTTFEKVVSIAPKAKARFVRFLFKTSPNKGKGQTLTDLLARSRGEYILFLDSDDVLTPQAVEQLLEGFLHDPSIVLTVGKNRFIDAEGKVTAWTIDIDGNTVAFPFFDEWLKESFTRNHPDCNLEQHFGSYAALLRDNHIPNGYMVKRSALTHVLPFSSKSPLEDIYMMLQLSKCGKLHLIATHTCDYRVHKTNTINRLDYFNNICRKTFFYEVKRFFSLPETEQKRLLPETLPMAHRFSLLGNNLSIGQLKWRQSVIVLTLFRWHFAFLIPKQCSRLFFLTQRHLKR